MGEVDGLGCVVDCKKFGSRRELFNDGDRAPFWLCDVTDKFCVAVVALLLVSVCPKVSSAPATEHPMLASAPSWSELPATELGALLLNNEDTDILLLMLGSTASGSDFLVAMLSREVAEAAFGTISSDFRPDESKGKGAPSCGPLMASKFETSRALLAEFMLWYRGLMLGRMAGGGIDISALETSPPVVSMSTCRLFCDDDCALWSSWKDERDRFDSPEVVLDSGSYELGIL